MCDWKADKLECWSIIHMSSLLGTKHKTEQKIHSNFEVLTVMALTQNVQSDCTIQKRMMQSTRRVIECARK